MGWNIGLKIRNRMIVLKNSDNLGQLWEFHQMMDNFDEISIERGKINFFF